MQARLLLPLVAYWRESADTEFLAGTALKEHNRDFGEHLAMWPFRKETKPEAPPAWWFGPGYACENEHVQTCQNDWICEKCGHEVQKAVLRFHKGANRYVGVYRYGHQFVRWEFPKESSTDG